MFKLVYGIIIFCFILIVVTSIVYGIALVQVLESPELIGQFFGEIVRGFNSVK